MALDIIQRTKDWNEGKLGEGRDPFAKDKEENEAEDILEMVEIGLPFIKDEKGDIFTVDKNYKLKKGEEFVTEKDYLAHNAETLFKTLKKNTAKIRQAENINRYKLRLDNYTQNVREFHKTQPFFYDKKGIFWWWDSVGKFYKIVDDTELLIGLDEIVGLDGQAVTRGMKVNYLEAFKQIGRRMIPKDAKVKWVQFKDKAYSIFSGKVHEVKPNYLFTNPIPWDIGEVPDTPAMDKLFSEWVGKENIQSLYEIIAYCCYRDYPIHTVFCFIGAGRNGKSTFLRILHKFLGNSNICSSELDSLLKGRFESFKLYKKLMCTLGETNFNIISNTSFLKKLVGQDLIGFEKKLCDPFDDYNYAKILIASNSLPSSKDTSEGFFRRWFIIDFPNNFPEGKDVLKEIPISEYNNLAKKVTEVLPGLLSNGKFTNQGDIKTRTMHYMMASNPLTLFIKEYCDVDPDNYCLYGEFTAAYLKYLKVNKRRRVMAKEIKEALQDEGYWIEKTSKKIGVGEGYGDFKSGWWVTGIKLKENLTILTKNTMFSLPSIRDIDRVENRKKRSQESQQVCQIEGCNVKECTIDSYGIPYCNKHYQKMAL